MGGARRQEPSTFVHTLKSLNPVKRCGIMGVVLLMSGVLVTLSWKNYKSGQRRLAHFYFLPLKPGQEVTGDRKLGG